MKYTKQLLFVVLLSVVIFSTDAFGGEVDLRINNVGIGTSYETIVKNLGKPLKSKKIRQILECSDNEPYTQLTVTYAGLIIELWNIEDTRKFTVLSIRLTAGSKLAVSGLKIGATRKETIARLGKPTYNSKSSLGYINKDNDGDATFDFKNGKLVSVNWSSAIC